jgi:hypothetical protein
MLAFPYKGGLSRFANLAGEARCPASLRREGKLQLSQGTAVENPWPRKFQKLSARQSLGRPLREADERNAKGPDSVTTADWSNGFQALAA